MVLAGTLDVGSSAYISEKNGDLGFEDIINLLVKKKKFIKQIAFGVKGLVLYS